MTQFTIQLQFQDDVPMYFMASSFKDQCDWLHVLKEAATNKTREVASQLPEAAVALFSNIDKDIATSVEVVCRPLTAAERERIMALDAEVHRHAMDEQRHAQRQEQDILLQRQEAERQTVEETHFAKQSELYRVTIG